MLTIRHRLDDCVPFDKIFESELKKDTSLSPVSSSSGHHSDGVVCVALEVSECGHSCCWVTEQHGGLTTSLSMIGHSGGLEAVGRWACTSPLPCYPDT